jgi:sugar phosphate isomerase/epimerase
MDRRNFISSAAALSAIATREAIAPSVASAASANPANAAAPAQKLVMQLWSRHLQWVSTAAEASSDPLGVGVRIGENCLAAGFSAVDLTVRSGGHVDPTLVRTNLGPMLRGIRSAGCLCTQIGANFAPSTDPRDTDWIASQYVHDILSTASANGVTHYRFYNSGGPAYAANTFGTDMTAQLDGMRQNLRRLAAISARYRMVGSMETHQNNIGASVQDYVYALQDINPHELGINFAIGHVASNQPGTWSVLQRLAMPSLRSTALQDLAPSINPATGALSIGTVACQGNGAGIINWKTFFSNLLLGGYSGPAEAQIEHTIVGALGKSVSLNSAAFADNVQFTSGNLTPAIMIAAMKNESGFYRAQALAAGWNASQVI